MIWRYIILRADGRTTTGEADSCNQAGAAMNRIVRDKAYATNSYMVQHTDRNGQPVWVCGDIRKFFIGSLHGLAEYTFNEVLDERNWS